MICWHVHILARHEQSVRAASSMPSSICIKLAVSGNCSPMISRITQPSTIIFGSGNRKAFGNVSMIAFGDTSASKRTDMRNRVLPLSYLLYESRDRLSRNPGGSQVELFRTRRNQVGEWRDLLALGNPVLHVVQEVHPQLAGCRR